MSVSLLGTASRAPELMPEQTWREVMALRWNNPHSDRLRRESDIDELRVAYDPARGCWLLARLRPVTVFRAGFGRNGGTLETVPVTWAEWRADPTDNTSEPLSIDDARLPSYIIRCDTWRQGGARALNAQLDAFQKAKREAPVKELKDRMTSREAMRVVKMLGDARGVVEHRATGPDAKRISNLGLFQRGVTAKPASGNLILSA